MSTCNLCGSIEFGDSPRTPGSKCAGCGSLERGRWCWLHLERIGVKSGARVAHFAPDRGLAERLLAICGDGYEAYDIAPEAYHHVPTRRFNLCRDRLEIGAYDFVIHNHVLEHVRCNWAAVLIGLHRALKPTGYHLFSVPFNAGRYSEDMTAHPEERLARFGQKGHVRNFGTKDAVDTLGMIFPSLSTGGFDKDALAAVNIRKRPGALTGASVFCIPASGISL